MFIIRDSFALYSFVITADAKTIFIHQLNLLPNAVEIAHLYFRKDIRYHHPSLFLKSGLVHADTVDCKFIATNSVRHLLQIRHPLLHMSPALRRL